MRRKWTEQDVPSQCNRVAVITGANAGVGFEVAKVLAARGASVVLAVRNATKGKQAIADIMRSAPGADVTVELVNLASLESIQSASNDLLAMHPRIDLLINNAGVLYTQRMQTCDGFEIQFGTNHLGHFALTGLLLKAMLSVPGSRVVTVSSLGHQCGTINWADLEWETSYDCVAAYGQSKIANLMFTYELQRRLSAGNAKTIAVAAHPGAARTDILRNSSFCYRALAWIAMPFGLFVAQSAAMGALPILRAATDPHAMGGQYYGPNGRWPRECKGYPALVEASPQAHDRDAQHQLWTISEELTGIRFPV